MKISSASAGIVLLILMLPLTALAGERFPDNPFEGAKIFSEKGCFKCHSIFGKGGNVAHDLGRIELGSSRLDVASRILNNTVAMTNKAHEMRLIWPRLTGQEIDYLVAYLYYVNYFDEAGSPDQGEKTFRNRGCNRCHAVSAADAKQEAPSLQTFSRGISPIYLAKSLWNHGPLMQARMESLGIAWPQFEGAEIMDLVAYIKGVARGEAEISYYTPGNPNDGAIVFKEKGCVRCHGPEARGGPSAPSLVERASVLQQSLTRVVARMWNHAPQIFARMNRLNMRVPQFTEREMADLVAYIYFLNYFPPPADIETGRKLFAEKRCSTCHAVGGGTQGIGPDLSLSEKTQSSFDLVASMWNHVPFMQATMLENEIPWPHFKKEELNDLLGYIRSLNK